MAKHRKVGKIPKIGTGDMDVIYKRSSNHSSLIQKTLRLVSSGEHQVVIPKTYLDTIEEMLPPIYLDRYSTYEIENTDATPRQKLENLKSLIDEIEAKALLKKPESKCNENVEEDDESVDEEEENVDEDDESVDEDDYYDAQLAYDYDESDQEEEESDQEEEEPDQEEEEPYQEEEESNQQEEEPDQEEEFDEEFPKLSYHYPVYTQEEEYEMEENREDYVEQTDTTYSRPTYH